MCSIFWGDHIAKSGKVEKEPSENILNKILILAERKYTNDPSINTLPDKSTFLLESIDEEYLQWIMSLV